MRHLCCIRIIIIFFIYISTLVASSYSKSAIVYYGDKISYSLIGIHDYIILQPNHVNSYSHGFKLFKDNIYAYISIGEIERELPYYSSISPEWIIGKNSLWSAEVMDISSEDYHNFMFENVIDPLIDRGFKNFFFDTLDSYHIVAKNDNEREVYANGLISFIKKFHKRYPDSKLIINRGFEIIDEVYNDIEAVLFESLFNGLSSKDLSYKEVSSSDREWLKMQIAKIKVYNKPIIAVDYLPPNSKKIDKNIEDIKKLGVIPYISTRDLNRIGKSSKEALKREVLILYDDTQYDGTDNDDQIFSTAFLHLSMPLEYMGYIPIVEPISTWKFSDLDIDRYAGAIIWLNGTYAIKYSKKFEKIVNDIYNHKIKLLILETINYNKHKDIYKTLQIAIKPIDNNSIKVKKSIKCDDSYIGFEIEPYIPSIDTIITSKNSKPICSINIGKEKSIISAITPWGGYAFKGSLITTIDEQNLWIVDPFKLIKDALRLPEIPIPDVTTQNGKRLLFTHIDGDGIMNRAEWNPQLFSGRVLIDEIFSKYDIPISISIIEAETAKYGLYPKLSNKLEKIAQDIYVLPNVEAATHTYSHPFFWKKVVDDYLSPNYYLKVKDYNFSIDREIRGSIEYINNRLEPKDRSTNMTFWSGDCLPTKTALEYIYKNNFLQINGGGTSITNSNPWLSFVAPLGIKRGDYYQVFTGAQNENVYTNNWLGPFWGYKRVIQTFKKTDNPRRLKPINIYHHLYSGSKRASLNALKKVYQWAIDQDVMPIYTSDYIPKVMDFYEISIAKLTKSRWLIRGTKSLKTIRIDGTKYIDFNLSTGVVGMKHHLKDLYLHLDQNITHIIDLSDRNLDQNYLIDANVNLVYHYKSKKQEEFKFIGEIPAQIRYHIVDGCDIVAKPKADDINRSNSIVKFSYLHDRDINVTINCQ